MEINFFNIIRNALYCILKLENPSGNKRLIELSSCRGKDGGLTQEPVRPPTGCCSCEGRTTILHFLNFNRYEFHVNISTGFRVVSSKPRDSRLVVCTSIIHVQKKKKNLIRYSRITAINTLFTSVVIIAPFFSKTLYKSFLEIF